MRIFFWPPTSHICRCGSDSSSRTRRSQWRRRREASSRSAAAAIAAWHLLAVCLPQCLWTHCAATTASRCRFGHCPPPRTVNDRFLYSTVSTLKPAQPSQQLQTSMEWCCSLPGGTLPRQDAPGGRLPHAPIVGIVVTTSPRRILYSAVVLPAASRPSMRMRISSFVVRDANILQSHR